MGKRCPPSIRPRGGEGGGGGEVGAGWERVASSDEGVNALKVGCAGTELEQRATNRIDRSLPCGRFACPIRSPIGWQIPRPTADAHLDHGRVNPPPTRLSAPPAAVGVPATPVEPPAPLGVWLPGAPPPAAGHAHSPPRRGLAQAVAGGVPLGPGHGGVGAHRPPLSPILTARGGWRDGGWRDGGHGRVHGASLPGSGGRVAGKRLYRPLEPAGKRGRHRRRCRCQPSRRRPLPPPGAPAPDRDVYGGVGGGGTWHGP